MAQKTPTDSLPKDICISTCLTRSCNIDELKKESQALDHSNQGLVGWWFGVSKDSKDPFAHIIQISLDHGRCLARSYSPWQLATSKKGTPLFEIYGMSSEEGEDKKAIYLKHKATAKNGKCMDYEPVLEAPSTAVFYLTPSAKTSGDEDRDKAVRILADLIAVNERNRNNPLVKMVRSKLKIDSDILTKAATDSGSRDSDGKDQAVVCIKFVVGNFKKKSKKDKKLELHEKKKNKGKLENESYEVPAVLERKCCFSFCVSVKEDKDEQFADNILEGCHSIDHVILDIAESMGKGKQKKKKDPSTWPLMCSQALNQALNQQPVLSGLTTFNKIIITESLDPLAGLYTSSNGYLVTEVIRFTRKFGEWQENGEKQEGPSEIEPYDYVEAVKLTGDPVLSAGQVTFRAKVGEKYKLPPGPVLLKEFGAVARYLGRGRLTGFQESRWVDVEVLILGEKSHKEGFAIGLLYSASKYHVLKLLRQLCLPGSQKSE